MVRLGIALLVLSTSLQSKAQVSSPEVHEPQPTAKSYYVGGALSIDGTISFYIDNTSRLVTGTVDRILNESYTTTSGAIELRLGASTLPPSSITSSSQVFTLGVQALSPLLPRYQYTNLVGMVPYTPPPDGTYYVYFGVLEKESGCTEPRGYCLDDYVQFPGQYTFVAGNLVNPISNAIEYYHAAFDHYFVTGIPEEIAALDGGQFAGWSRTGQTFKVWNLAATGRVPVCRFFSTSFSPKSSHFYTPIAAECATVKNNRNWQYEGEVAQVVLPTGAGLCSTGIPLYRLYNNGQGGAPNHRYTTSASVRQTMILRNWVPEGFGSMGVIACVPT